MLAVLENSEKLTKAIKQQNILACLGAKIWRILFICYTLIYVVITYDKHTVCLWGSLKYTDIWINI